MGGVIVEAPGERVRRGRSLFLVGRVRRGWCAGAGQGEAVLRCPVVSGGPG